MIGTRINTEDTDKTIAGSERATLSVSAPCLLRKQARTQSQIFDPYGGMLVEERVVVRERKKSEEDRIGRMIGTRINTDDTVLFNGRKRTG